MKSFTYHAYQDTSSDGFNMCSRECDELPLLINCAGFMNISVPFCTHNKLGRSDYYLMYITAGTLDVFLPSGKVRAGAGDFFIFPPRYKYRYRLNQGGEISYYFVHFTGSFAAALLEKLGFSELPARGECDATRGAVLRFEEIFTSFSKNEDYRDVTLGAILQQLLAYIVSDGEAQSRSLRIKKSVEYINTFYTEEISIGALAKMDNVSISRYNAIFREIMGKSPSEYIIDLRIKHACTLLDTTDIAIGLIGEAVGYGDKHFFSKMFKKRLGISPRSYRDRRNI